MLYVVILLIFVLKNKLAELYVVDEELSGFLVAGRELLYVFKHASSLY